MMKKILFIILLLIIFPSVSHGTVLGGGGYLNPFGDGSDGVYEEKVSDTWYPDTAGGPIVKQYSSFTLSNGHSISPSGANEGIYIFVNGSATVAGEIVQTNMAGTATPAHSVPGVAIISRRTTDHSLSISSLPGISDALATVVGGAGGNGGYALGTASSGEPGTIMGGGCGGGGEGGGAVGEIGYVNQYNKGINAAYGSAGAANSFAPITCNRGGTVNSGAGGAGSNNPGGAIWIIAKSLTISSTARLRVNSTATGNNGGNASINYGACRSDCYADGGSGGGGAGGGLVALCYMSLTDSSTTLCFPRTGSGAGTGGTNCTGSYGAHGGNGANGSDGHVYKIDLKAGTITTVY